MKSRLYSSMRTCFHHHSLSLLLPFLSEIFSSVGVSSGQEVIAAAVGNSVRFLTQVPASGNIIYKGDTVGQVLNKQTDTNLTVKFMNRLHWDSQSGFFTLSDLRTDDSGLYRVESTKDLKGKQDYQLEVYERVSAPQVMNAGSSSSEFCSLLCSVRNIRGLKLIWYKDGVLLNRTSSSNTSDNTLNLHLEIKKTDNHRQRSFSCEASNPVSRETTTINIPHYCSLGTDVESEAEVPVSSTIFVTVMCAVMSVMAVVVIVVCLWKRNDSESGVCAEDRNQFD